MKPTPEQEAAVLRVLAEDCTECSAAGIADLMDGSADGRTVRAWLRHLLTEGKVRRVATGPERWSLL